MPFNYKYVYKELDMKLLLNINMCFRLFDKKAVMVWTLKPVRKRKMFTKAKIDENKFRWNKSWNANLRDKKCSQWIESFGPKYKGFQINLQWI